MIQIMKNLHFNNVKGKNMRKDKFSFYHDFEGN